MGAYHCRRTVKSSFFVKLGNFSMLTLLPLLRLLRQLCLLGRPSPWSIHNRTPLVLQRTTDLCANNFAARRCGCKHSEFTIVGALLRHENRSCCGHEKPAFHPMSLGGTIAPARPGYRIWRWPCLCNLWVTPASTPPHMGF